MVITGKQLITYSVTKSGSIYIDFKIDNDIYVYRFILDSGNHQFYNLDKEFKINMISRSNGSMVFYKYNKSGNQTVEKVWETTEVLATLTLEESIVHVDHPTHLVVPRDLWSVILLS